MSDIKNVELTEENINEMEKIRLQKLNELKEKGLDPFKEEVYDVKHFSSDIIQEFDKYENADVSMAGRIMANRHMGKASFIDIKDRDGKIQGYVKKDNIGEDAYEAFLKYDIGDIIGFTGSVFKTRHGEISINISKIKLLSKSLRILPEKWHGLKDPELKYRRRYVDLIINDDVKELFIKREKIIHAFKDFLHEQNYHEVDTPILTTIAGGANARPFNTHHNTLDIDMKLRISNELFLKRLIVGGMDRVYEMGKMFRNEGMDKNHNPEYTSIELYAAYQNLEDMMWLTENIVAESAKAVNGTTVIEYDGKTIDLKAPWKRLNMCDAVKEKTGVDFREINEPEAVALAKKYGAEDSELLNYGTALVELFEILCEDELISPCFVEGHPIEVSPLAKKDPKDERFTRRFEAYINGWEIANAFSELNDPIDQLERFKQQQGELEKGDDEAHPMDEDYVLALEYGLPPTGGLGIGVDRVIMLLTGAKTIRDIILFPTMKEVK